jgi:isoprenylcysteine carboxyl methyltransferase (ICMT) family protein YpbQ
MKSEKAALSENADVTTVQPGQRSKYIFLALSAFLFCAFGFQLWFHAARTSATLDEGAHIIAGHRHLQCGDFGINPEHPPLLKLVAAVPLEFRALKEPDWECGSRLTPKPEMFSAGTLFIVENGIDSVVIPTRLAASVMSLLLAALVFLAAREMFGRAEAVTALAILAFEPSLIAHGSLVMTDMVLTTTAFGTVYALYRYRKHPNWLRFLIVGAAFGLLLAAKHSALIFVPVLFVVLTADELLFRRSETRLLPQILRQTTAFAAFFLIGLIVLWAFYGFRYYSIPNASTGTISVADYIKENGRPEMIESFSAKMVERINRTHLFPESYVLGMADVVAWGSRNSFLFGKNYPTGKWFYFPVAFTVKSSVALLLLLPLGLLFPFVNREKRREALFLLAPPLLFFGIALTSSMTIGIRHILPVYGFFIVASAAGAVWLARKFAFFKFLLLALLVFHAVTAVRTAPHYAAFANDFWGGIDNTHRIFTDSNVDFGQNLKLINEYLARENITDCWIAAFNHPAMARAMQPCRVLPSGLRILVSQTVIEPVPPVIEGTVLVSVNELPPRSAGEYAPFTRSEPVAFLGGNTFVYRGRFEVLLAAAMSHAYRSGQFLRANRVEEAVSEGRQAVELGGGDPRTHLSLGLALIRAGQKDEARREFETAVGLAKSDPVFRNAEVRAQQELKRLSGN